MKERQVLFNAEMIRAILCGKKTQTRRVVRAEYPPAHFSDIYQDGGDFWWWSRSMSGAGAEQQDLAMIPRCPYGQPGDQLWVRETWKVGAWRDDGRIAIDYKASPEIVHTPWCVPPDSHVWHAQKIIAQSWKDCHSALDDGFEGIEEGTYGRLVWDPGNSPCRWRPSIHMPRWASRLTLEIADVRVERLQDISEADARAEGVGIAPAYAPAGDLVFDGSNGRYAESFMSVWDSIAKPGEKWADNPWAWALTFKVLADGRKS